MTAVRPMTRGDRRAVAAFERSTAALGRSTGRAQRAERPDPLAHELRSSLLLFLAVLGVPLLLIVLLAA